MHKAIKFLIGLVLLVPGALSLYPFVSPEAPVRLAFNNRSMGEPFATIVQKWFQFSDFLQTATTSDYLGALFLCFGLTVAGLFTCLKALR